MLSNYDYDLSDFSPGTNEILESVSEEGEAWKPCPGFENKYLISSHGRVLSIGTYNTCKKGKLLKLHQKKVSSHRKEGYVQVQLYDSNRFSTVEVHRLVALAFIPNPNNYKVIVHLDEDRTNNRVDNLEWRDVKNIIRHDQTKSVDVYNIEGILLNSFKSIKEAAKFYSLNKESITRCCKDPYGFTKGMQFRYKGEPFSTKIDAEHPSEYLDEEWRSVVGFENYRVSNYGRVKNSRGWLIREHYNRKGYAMVRLSKDNKSRSIQVHRLVAEAFIPNPNNYPSINHIDEHKTNNIVTNLEWCTSAYNTRYSHAKRILQYTLSGVLVKSWEAISDIEKDLGIPNSSITKCCKGIIKTIGGFVFLYPGDSITNRLLEIKNRKHKSKSENVRQLSLSSGG